MGLKTDVKEIKQDVKQMLQEQARHNEILRTHEARSLTLQEAQSVQKAEVTKLKEHDKLWTKLAAILAAALVGGVAQALLHYFSS
jgi:hypothetical protein